MNSSPQPHDPAIDEQAALWAARLDGDTLDAAQRTELDAWLAAHPAHRALLSQYCQFSADLEERLPALVHAGAVALPDAGKAVRRRWTLPRVTAVAFAAAAALALAFVALRPAPQVENFAMASLQRGTRTLADGTRVELNANTSIRFENRKAERHVLLAGGEALFTVARDPHRPFTVETPTGSVRVTGTTFNVRTEAGTSELEVTVVEGSVQVRPIAAHHAQESQPIALVPGDQLSARAGKVSTQQLSANEVDDALAWRAGHIVFRDTPLQEALARYARHHGRSITAAPGVARQTIGGRYSIDDLSGFLSGLELMLPVKANLDLSGAYTVVPRTGS